MKKVASHFFTILLCFNLFMATAAASGVQVERIEYDDGSYAIIETVVSEKGLARATTTDSKTYTYYNASNVKCFSYTLYATFSYNGSTSSATQCSGSASISLRGWELDTHNEYTSGNCAYGSAIFTGPSGEQRNASLYLRCDKNGNVT